VGAHSRTGEILRYDAQETAADTLSGTELVHLLVDVVARGGNLLVNVGPDGGGQIPEIQQRPLRELGDWLRTNGQAIYATQPWPRPATTSSSGHQVRYTRKNKTLYAIVLSDRLPDNLAIEDLALPPGSRIRTLNGDADLAWTQVGNDVLINTAQPSSGPHAQVLAISMSSAPGDLREDPPGVATGS
jgi:alpha-L-fucosidase